MDLRITDWLAATETASTVDAASIAAVGEALLREEPHLPLAITAECHVRIAALRMRAGDAPLALRHAVYAAQLAFDMSAESQLHVLPRALGVARSADLAIDESLPDAERVLGLGASTVGSAMTAAIDTADRGLVELAVLQALTDSVVPMDEAERRTMDTALAQHGARVALQLETFGEAKLAEQASRVGARANDT